MSEVAAQDRSRADITIFPDGHAPDQDGGRVNERGFPHLRAFSFEFINRHKVYPLPEILRIWKAGIVEDLPGGFKGFF
jgi:hypothetical protein